MISVSCFLLVGFQFSIVFSFFLLPSIAVERGWIWYCEFLVVIFVVVVFILFVGFGPAPSIHR